MKNLPAGFLIPVGIVRRLAYDLPCFLADSYAVVVAVRDQLASSLWARSCCDSVRCCLAHMGSVWHRLLRVSLRLSWIVFVSFCLSSSLFVSLRFSSSIFSKQNTISFPASPQDTFLPLIGLNGPQHMLNPLHFRP